MPKNKITQKEAARLAAETSDYFDNAIPQSALGSMGESMSLDLARIVKLQEEAGEVVEAYIGFWALNPRKGQTVQEEVAVADEALDLAVASLLVAEHFYGNSGLSIERLFQKLKAVHDRAKEDDASKPGKSLFPLAG